MRQLKIIGQNSKPFLLDDVPDEYRFVESLAKWSADTQDEMVSLNQVGVEKAMHLKNVLYEKQYERFAAWAVRQAIYQSKGGNNAALGDNGGGITK